MKDFLYLGPVPCDESCAQVGDNDFRRKATIEMKAYISLLKRKFPLTEESGVTLRIKWENHDFGAYGEVVAEYDYHNEEALAYALRIENNLPYEWDETALMELIEAREALNK